MRSWRAYRRLDRADRAIALEAAAGLALAGIGLRLAGLRPWKALRAYRPVRKVSPSPLGAELAVARKIARIQEAVSRHLIWHPSCLERSLTLCWQLNRRGIRPQMRIGARKQAGRFEAHAWVEVGNVILNDSGETHRHFAPFDGSILTLET